MKKLALIVGLLAAFALPVATIQAAPTTNAKTTHVAKASVTPCYHYCSWKNGVPCGRDHNGWMVYDVNTGQRWYCIGISRWTIWEDWVWWEDWTDGN